MAELSSSTSERRHSSTAASAFSSRLRSEHRSENQRNNGNADDHGASYSIATVSSSAASTSVASLIQSAAKMSLLGVERTSQGIRRSAHAPTRLFADDEYDNMDDLHKLRSLQKAVLPAMPDEQDRKRFVGCLAAIIASLYDYDENDEHVDTNDQASESQHHNLDASDSFYESMHDDDTTDSNRDCGENSLVGADPNDRTRQHTGSTRRQEHTPTIPTQPPSGQSRREIAAARSQARHRQRRHNVFSRLLASSAELLQLDKVHGMGFLPVVDKLLGPTIKKKSKRRQHGNFVLETDFLEYHMDRVEHLRPFLDGLGAGAGLRCLVMFLLQHLLHSPKGYDARVRHAIKTVGVLVLVHDSMLEKLQNVGDEKQHVGSHSPREDVVSSKHDTVLVDVATLATRKFEALERYLAVKLIEMSKANQRSDDRRGKRENAGSLTKHGSGITSREKIMRGLKIGGTAFAAGTLFAITGGLAAPGIAAGIAAIAGTTAVAAAAAALTTTAAVTTIFGVGGGGLVAYKMQRRTVGLTEFEFCKEASAEQLAKQMVPRSQSPSVEYDDMSDVELFGTICISGWLCDDCDFQRPWGLSPTRPPIEDRLELLERFYSVHRPGHVSKCAKILENWKGEENELWSLIRFNYGRDPDRLFPFVDGPKYQANLSLEEKEIATQLLEYLGCNVPSPPSHEPGQQTPFERIQVQNILETEQTSIHPSSAQQMDELITSWAVDDTSPNDTEQESEADVSKLKHLLTVWDYRAIYGGELYTVRWESALLEELCNSVTDLAAGVVTGATTHLLKFTALSTLVAAMALPAALKSAANLIDGTWTLVVERADEAGRELAKSLLFSSAGSRPITLVGFSFGARVIYSCLKELARIQDMWEDFHESTDQPGIHRQQKTFQGKWDSAFEKMREPASIVGDAIVMGLPNHLSISSWQACRQVVAGRLVSCFSHNDLILSLMFQYKKFGLKPGTSFSSMCGFGADHHRVTHSREVCGTCAVNVPGVENVDVSDLVAGHQDYCFVTGEIMKRVRHGNPFQAKTGNFTEETTI